MGFRSRKGFQRILGQGPDYASILIIGDRPGQEEMYKGYPFAGRTGDELNRKLWDIRLERDNLFLANLLLQQPLGKEITPQEIQRDEPELWRILDTHRFDLIVTLGATTTKYFLGPDANLEKNHAIAHTMQICTSCGRFYASRPASTQSQETYNYNRRLLEMDRSAQAGWIWPSLVQRQTTVSPQREIQCCPSCGKVGKEIVIFPAYHLAAGFHTPDLQPFIEYDWMVLGQYLKGIYTPPSEDIFKGREKYELANKVSFALLLQTLEERPSLKPGVDTEGLLGSAWGLSISVGAGTSLVLRVGVTPHEWFKHLGEVLLRRTVLLHNSLHDIPILRELGIEIGDFEDTMVKAFLLQVEPQGLKPLSFRHSGMEMNDYLDVVAPYAKELYADYIFKASELDWDADTFKMVPFKRKKKDGSIVESFQKRRVLGIGSRLGKFALDIAKGKTTDIKKRWDNIDEDITDKIIERVGLFPEAGLEHVPDEVAIPYSARDADATFRLDPALAPKIAALDLERVCRLDHAVIPMVERMQSRGFQINRNYLKGLGTVLSLQMDDRRDKLRNLTGRSEFNPGSGDQVADYLFNTLGLPPIKMTKGGKRPAVDDKVMEELLIREVDNPLVTEFINLKGDYTEAEKLLGTYVDNLDKYAGADDVIHTHIRITRVVSGRFATFDPNLLAIPVKSQLGRLVRGGFVARPGKILGAWDLDQQEIRVLAHESGDPTMIEVLSDPKRHFHKETCGRIYGVDPKTVSKESSEYMGAKNVSFGIAYMITAKGLQAQMAQRGQKCTEADAQKMIDDWYGVYPGVRVYHERCRAFAARYGYIRTMLGRIRYLPGIHSSLPYIRSEAERAAGNHPIQGGAADITKTWMVHLWKHIAKGDLRGVCEPLLSVHDEIILEINEGMEPLVDFYVKETLEQTVKELELKVPMGCGGKFAYNWQGLK